MMTRRQFLGKAAVALSAASTTACRCRREDRAKAPAAPGARPVPAARASPARPSRLLSLRWLQQAALAAPWERLAADGPELRLAGLTRLDGFHVDATLRDVVLFGSTDPADGPLLHTADLVVALRSATHRLLDRAGRFTPPGVSLNPQPAVVRRLMAFDGRDLHGEGAAAERAARAWGAICGAPQDVQVLGLREEGNHYLWVIERADETLKSYVDGTLELRGLEVPSRMTLAAYERELRAGRVPKARRGFAMSRYWFNAGKNRVAVHADGTYVLRQSDVRLSTEAQLLSRGKLEDGGERDDLAERCAASFTRLLPDLARAEPLYRELLDVYRVQSLAVAMVRARALERAGLSLDPLLDGWRAPSQPVPRQVPGRWAVHGLDFRQPVERGERRFTLRIPSCGGVTVSPEPALVAVASDPCVAGMRAALGGRPRAGASHWDALLPGCAS